MKTENIHSLLTKFYNGEISPKEESAFMDFFRQENLSVEWEKDRELVLALSTFEPEIPADLERKMEIFIDSIEKSESITQKNNPKIRIWKYAGIAASVLLIIGIGFRDQSQKTNDAYLLTDTYKTSEQAQEATMQALQLFSQHFSKGVEPLQKAEKRIEETQEIVQRVLNK